MARANRHYIPGCVWHITHRCHKREFLLRFARDRQRWLQCKNCAEVDLAKGGRGEWIL
jgi:REP element-mobilizing transposase RayT